jgi:adenylate cyclase, class 2
MQKMNYRDFTLKARIGTIEKIDKRLLELGANCIGTDTQVDRYFEVAQGRLKWRQGTIENLITHYERTQDPDSGLEQTTVYRYDLDPTPEMIEALYKEFKESGCIRKQRTIYWLDIVKIHLDKLEDGKRFIELEAIDRENRFSLTELRNQCQHVQQALCIANEALIPTGYFHY